MTLLIFLRILLAEVGSVLGQILFKYGLGGEHAGAKVAWVMTAGITAKTMEFFLWQGLLDHFPLSYLYPFDALNRVMLLVGASIFLKERATPALWLGVLLITAGVAVVSATG